MIIYALDTEAYGILDFDELVDINYSSLIWNIFLYDHEKLVKKDISRLITNYGTMFKPKNIDNMTESDFNLFLKFSNNKNWNGL